ncbi:MAG: HlyC/CorC family transporter [Candidatus Competibacter sp.]|nr:HlyC/CorC family transporter [Candidatus Competibacter sp.]
MENFLWVVAALLLVALNGFFVAVEFGLVKLRQTRIRAIVKIYGLRGRILSTVHSRLDAYLSACQLGITLASLALGWIGEPAFARLLTPVFGWLDITSPELMHIISIVFAFSAITFLHIVVGEQAPKSLAIRRPEKVSIWAAIPLYAFYCVMYPAIWLLNVSATGVLRLAGLDGGHGHETNYSAEEIKLIVRGSHPTEKLNQDELQVIAYTLDFSDLEVSELMRPISEVTGLYQARSLGQNLDTIYHSRFSRYPYFERDGETALGIIHLKDLFLAQQQGKSIGNLNDYLRPVQYVAPNTPAVELFRRFRKGAPHFAIVGQKGGRAEGFITLDDMLGALVGGIRDEFRQNQNDWIRLDDDTFMGKGSLPIFTLERVLGIEIENENVDSVGGLVMWKLGDVPHEGQKVEFDQFDVVVKKMNGPRIMLVRVYPKESASS